MNSMMVYKYMKATSNPRILGMVFTYGVSLDEWVRTGLFDREKLIYENHIKQGHFSQIIWFTYGYRDEELRNNLVKNKKLDKNILVVGLPIWGSNSFTKLIYSYILPCLRKQYCKRLSIVKSNQLGGARVAAAIAKRYKIPFDLRTGYTYTLFQEKKLEDSAMTGFERIKKRLWARYYYREENRLYRACDMATVSSSADRDYIVSKYSIPEKKITLLTNYIDCEKFSAMNLVESRARRVLFVGRLSRQKNLVNLIKSLSDLDIGLDIYGDGEQETILKETASNFGVDVRFMGKVNNNDLPEVYNSYRYFILPSLYEGMPKTLLEAMACGCICIGTNVEGIKEVISNKVNGFIIDGIDANSINNKITEVVSENDDRSILDCSAEAVRYIQENHSLGTITKAEWEAMLCLID